MEVTTIQWIIFGVLIFIFLVISGIAVGIISYRLKWPLRYEDYHKVNGKYYRVRKGRARLVKFGDGGENIYFLKGIKKYRAGYGKTIGKNTVAWFEGDDGYMYNCDFEDINKKLLQIGVMPIDRDMRFSSTTLRKGIENRYNQKNFMEKYGIIIAFGMLFLCILAMGGFLWIGLNKVNAMNTMAADNLKVQKDVMELSRQVLMQIANLRSGGTGGSYSFTPVNRTA